MTDSGQSRSGTYNLSLAGDEELAQNAGLASAKQAKTQFNASDCGPLTLFASAIRSAMKPGWNEFKFAGREKLEKDTGVHIYQREELIKPVK